MDMWNTETAILKIEGLDIEVPAWIDQDISPNDVAAIVEGGCASGAYMPAVTYHQARETMGEHGDAVCNTSKIRSANCPSPRMANPGPGLRSSICPAPLNCGHRALRASLRHSSLPKLRPRHDLRPRLSDDRAVSGRVGGSWVCFCIGGRGGMIFGASRKRYESARRAQAFLAGYRCAQNLELSRRGSAGPALVDWEIEEARNAIAHGFTEAAKTPGVGP